MNKPTRIWMNILGSVALTALCACDFEKVDPYPQAPPPAPVPAGVGTYPHRNPQHGFAAPGQTDFVPGPGSSTTAPDAGGGSGAPGPIDPACAALPPGDACTECLKGDCCAVLLKCTADKACSCLLNCVTTKPDNILGCAVAGGCGIPDATFLSELTSCSTGCVEAKVCTLPKLPGLDGLGGLGLGGLKGLGGLLGGLGKAAARAQ